MASSSSSLPRRSSTLFERSTTSVRRLARKISLSVLNPRERPELRPSSVATARSEVSAPLERPRSRLARWRSGRASGVSPPAVVEEEGSGEELMRSATPRGFGDIPERRKEVQEVKILWPVPKARVFRQVRGGEHAEYDITSLVYGRKANELWFPTGDTLIYLCSKSESHRYQPSFKLSASILRKKSEFFTTALSERWQEHSATHRQTLVKEGARYILYFPPWESSDESYEEEDSRNLKAEVDFHDLLNQLVATRNFFAYLFGRPAVYLEDPLGGSLLSDFMDRMEMYVLGSNADIKGRPTREQTLQEIELWIRIKELDDSRKAPHKIIDTLLISERYQWIEIYTEGFIHASGRYDFIFNLSDFTLLSPSTKQLLERASYSIKARVRTTEASLSSFSFPILSSSRPRQSGTRRRRSDDMNIEIPRAWRRSYSSFKKWVVQYYTAIFRVRSWPPARFSRGMILMLQNDFKALYDLLIDDSANLDRGDHYRRLLSQVLTDFNPFSSPPPLPRLPALPLETSPSHNRRQSREAISVVLLDSYNLLTTSSGGNKFVEAFKEFERDYGANRVVTKSVEAREGRWCLVVAVLATLRGVVDEWVGLRYGWGVEYWLCAELKDVPPWSARRSASALSRGRGTGLVSRTDTDVDEDDDEEEDEEPVRRPGRSVFG